MISAMNNSLAIELGPILNLYQRIATEDSSRSIALAKRTFERSAINKQKIVDLAQTNDVNSLIDCLNDLILLQKSPRLNTQEFLQSVETLLSLI